MHALIDKFASAGYFGVGTPFFIVADPPAMAVAAPNKHHRPQRTGRENLAGLTKCPVIAMIEAYPYQRSGASRGVSHGFEFRCGSCARFFDENVFAMRRGS